MLMLTRACAEPDGLDGLDDPFPKHSTASNHNLSCASRLLWVLSAGDKRTTQISDVVTNERATIRT